MVDARIRVGMLARDALARVDNLLFQGQSLSNVLRTRHVDCNCRPNTACLLAVHVSLAIAGQNVNVMPDSVAVWGVWGPKRFPYRSVVPMPTNIRGALRGVYDGEYWNGISYHANMEMKELIQEMRKGALSDRR